MINRLELSLLKLYEPLPNWSIEPILDGEAPSVHDFLGQSLLILFFNLGCPGCLGRAIPYANRISYENGERMKVIGIHTNFEGVDFGVQRFIEAQKELHIRFPMYRDYNYDTTFLNYGAGGTPHWILVNHQGNVLYSIFGSDPNNALLRLDYMIGESLIDQQNSLLR